MSLKGEYYKVLFDKYKKLLDVIQAYGSVGVAFSGGVDSSLLLRAAIEACSHNVVALFANSQLQKKQVAERASLICQLFGCIFEPVSFDPLEVADFVRNDEERCYFCKKIFYTKFLTLLPQGSILLDGTNIDDIKCHRPGMRAILELGVKMPLVEVGLGKQEIRTISKELGITSWDTFSESCLATRIGKDVLITDKLLKIVESAEDLLECKGFKGCRVKIIPPCAYVSLAEGDISRFALSPLRDELLAFLAKEKIAKVFLELSERPGIVV